jgi:hypothetical protein
MSLPIGSIQSPPQLPGRWTVWSKAADQPGAYFLIPLDDQAKGFGVSYAVVKATQRRDAARPTLSVIRTDPHKELT